MDTDKKLNGLKITCIGQASMDDTHGSATRLKTLINLLEAGVNLRGVHQIEPLVFPDIQIRRSRHETWIDNTFKTVTTPDGVTEQYIIRFKLNGGKKCI